MDPPEQPTGFVVVVGPTAAGKSALALTLAAGCQGEIVNADAMQMYVGLDIGTAKATVEERLRVPHHCLDIWPLDQVASVAQFQRLGRAAVTDILARNVLPIVVGGSPLYVRALADRLEIPPHDPSVRQRLVAEAEALGGQALHERLRQRDSAAAEAIDPRNTRRVIRALEVVELAGSFTATMPPPRPWRPALWLGVDLPRPELDERVAARTQAMWDAGLLAETAALAELGLAHAPTAGRAIGYEQALAVLAGAMAETDARAETVRLTRRLARRQQRTFHHDSRIHWLSPGDAGERGAIELTAALVQARRR